MAIYHLSAQILSRANGSSALCAAAYRHGAKMAFEREDRDVSYQGKHEVAETGIALPEAVPEWLRTGMEGLDSDRASAFLWNAVEGFEKRKDAQLAREIDAALPVELSHAERVAVIREFAGIFTERGMVVDWAYHDLEDNPHVHLMMTLRPLTEEGFGAKRVPVLDAEGQPVMRTWANGRTQPVLEPWAGDRKGEALVEWRAAWASVVNAALLRAGHGVAIDHRSHVERGISVEATRHRGVHANGMERRGLATERSTADLERQERNTAYLRQAPGHILHIVADKRAVFTEGDVEGELSRCIPEAGLRAEILVRAMASPDLVTLADPVFETGSGQGVEAARYTTRDMLAVEREMADRAVRMAAAAGFGVGTRHVEAAIASVNGRLAGSGGALSPEQETAIRAVTGEGGIRAVVGLAGTGKSTMLEAARLAWEAAGYRVRGVALAGKAVEELQEASGIRARTVASFEARLDRGSDLLRQGDILVVDEAGMIGSKQMARLLRAAEAGQAKVVLAGDPDQLQPIAAGAAFRAVTERVGFVEIAGIRRQTSAWMRAASVDFARGRIREALTAYAEHGADRGYRVKAAAIAGMARAIVRDRERVSSVLGLAHSNRDVRALNDAVRAVRREAGGLGEEAVLETSTGPRAFARDDRIVFLQNDAELGVRNGMLGTVTDHAEGRLTVRTDGGADVAFRAERYGHVDHGYAVTVHKSQGATVDSVHVLATRSITRNLAYVAMTRHRERAALHYSRASFRVFAGGIVEAMSRPDIKATTLDYVTGLDGESAIAFGERRGFASRGPVVRTMRTILARQAGRVAEVFARFVQLAPVASRDQEWLLAPVTAAQRDIDRLARERALAADRVVEAERVLKAAASEVFRDVEAAMREFRKVLDQPPEAVHVLTRRMLEAPESVAALRGETGFLVRRAARAERAAAVEALPGLYFRLQAYRGRFGAVEAEVRAGEHERITRLGVGVPALSRREEALLDRLDLALREGGDAFASALGDTQREDPGSLARIGAFRDALQKRVGPVGRFLTQGSDAAGGAEPDDRTVLEKHRPRIEQTVRVTREIGRAFQRTQAQERGLEPGR